MYNIKLFLTATVLVSLAVFTNACNDRADKGENAVSAGVKDSSSITATPGYAVLENCLQRVTGKTDSLIVRLLRVDASKVTPAASLIKDLGADELDIVEFVMELEKEFHIAIRDEQVVHSPVMNDFYKIVFTKVCEGK